MRYVSINEGLVLCRQKTGDVQWQMLNNTGKWADGTQFMVPYVYNGELGAEDVTEADARVIAEKLGGSIDGS